MTISNCCGAEVKYHSSREGTGYMSCQKCLKPCDIKPMKHTVKVGDRFKLGPWEWRVRELRFTSFIAESEANLRMITLYDEDADQLDWVKPEPTCSKEFAEALQVELKRKWIDCDQIDRWLDSHTEKE